MISRSPSQRAGSLHVVFFQEQATAEIRKNRAGGHGPGSTRLLPGQNPDLGLQRTMDRALVGDLHQLVALFGIESAVDGDYPLDLVEHALLGFAFGAIP